MRIIVSTPDHARHIGKRLSSVLGVPLTRGYFVAARLLGYKSWDELLQFCDWSPGYFTSQAALPDSQCMPLAMAMRRQFQVRTLAEVASIASERAAEIVALVRPSDGFRRPQHPLGDGRPPPRRTDPKLAPATHAQLSANLHTVWQVVGHQGRMAKPLREVALLLERLQLEEWPMNQFLYDLKQTPYGGWSPTYLANLRRAPKFVASSDAQRCKQLLDGIGTTVARAQIQGLEEHTARLAVLIDQAHHLLGDWRDRSAPHDGEPVRFDGVPPQEDDGVDLLQRLLHLTEHQVFVLSDAAFDLDEARRLLDAIGKLDVQAKDLKSVRFVVSKLRRGIARCDRDQNAAEARRQPLTRHWDVWGIGAGAVVNLGTFATTSSMKAIAAAPGFVAGRVIAVPSGLRPWRHAQPAPNSEHAGGELRS